MNTKVKEKVVELASEIAQLQTDRIYGSPKIGTTNTYPEKAQDFFMVVHSDIEDEIYKSIEKYL